MSEKETKNFRMIFSQSLTMLVSHRGLAAEQRLIERLTAKRLRELYEGAKPTCHEVAIVAEVLGVGIAQICPVHPALETDLNQSVDTAAILGSFMEPAQQKTLARAINGLVAAAVSSGAEETSRASLKVISGGADGCS